MLEGARGSLRGPVLVTLLFACASCSARGVAPSLALPADARSVIFAWLEETPVLRASDRADLSPPIALSWLEPGSLAVLAYPRPLAELQIDPGRMALRSEGRKLPTAGEIWTWREGDAAWEAVTALPPALDAVRIPAFDLDRCASEGGCLTSAGDEHCTLECAVAAPLEPAPVASATRPVSPAVECPEGWEEQPVSDTDASLCWPRLVELASCPDPGTVPSASVSACRPIGSACSGGWPAPQLLPVDRPVLYVKADAGPGSGDGTQARPFRSIAAALAAPAGRPIAIALHEGTYVEDGTLGIDEVSLIGACAANTRIDHPFWTPALDLQRSSASVRDVSITGGSAAICVDPRGGGDPPVLHVSGVLIAGGLGTGAIVQNGARLVASDLVVRDRGGSGLIARDGAVIEIQRAVFERVVGRAIGADRGVRATLDDVLFRAATSTRGDDAPAVSAGAGSTVMLSDIRIEDAIGVGIALFGPTAIASIRRASIRGVTTGPYGTGWSVLAGEGVGLEATEVAIERSAGAAWVFGRGSTATVSQSAVRDSARESFVAAEGGSAVLRKVWIEESREGAIELIAGGALDVEDLVAVGRTSTATMVVSRDGGRFALRRAVMVTSGTALALGPGEAEISDLDARGSITSLPARVGIDIFDGARATLRRVRVARMGYGGVTARASEVDIEDLIVQDAAWEHEPIEMAVSSCLLIQRVPGLVIRRAELRGCQERGLLIEVPDPAPILIEDLSIEGVTTRAGPEKPAAYAVYAGRTATVTIRRASIRDVRGTAVAFTAANVALEDVVIDGDVDREGLSIGDRVILNAARLRLEGVAGDAVLVSLSEREPDAADASRISITDFVGAGAGGVRLEQYTTFILERFHLSRLKSFAIDLGDLEKEIPTPLIREGFVEGGRVRVRKGDEREVFVRVRYRDAPGPVVTVR